MKSNDAGSPFSAGFERRYLCIAVGLVFVACVGRLAWLVLRAAVNLPFEDQWDLLRPVFENDGLLACFRWQHGPHRQGLGGVINWALYPATDWDVRVESWLGVAILAMAAILSLKLVASLRGRMAWSDLRLPLLLLSPLHWETLLLTPNLAHSILPLMLVLLLAVLWSGVVSVGGLIWINVVMGACLYTGFGLCGAVVVIVLSCTLVARFPWQGADFGRCSGIVFCAIQAAILFSFAVRYRWSPAVSGWYFPVEPWWDYGRFAFLMYASLLGWREITNVSMLLGGVVFGAVFLAFLFSAWRIWLRKGTPRDRVIWILNGTSLLYASLTAFGRLPINIEAAFMWRYTTLMMPGLVGLFLFGEKLIEGRSQAIRGCVAVASLVTCGLVWGNFSPDCAAKATAAAKREWLAAYLRTRDLAQANQESKFWVYFPAPNSPMIAERLRFMETHRLSFFRQPSAAPASRKE